MNPASTGECWANWVYGGALAAAEVTSCSAGSRWLLMPNPCTTSTSTGQDRDVLVGNAFVVLPTENCALRLSSAWDCDWRTVRLLRIVPIRVARCGVKAITGLGGDMTRGDHATGQS